MIRLILIYGFCLALLAMALKMLEYRFLLRDLSIEIYIGSIAVVFTVIGAWVGHKLNTRRKQIPVAEPGSEVINKIQIEKTGISPREYEVLMLMAQGCSNQEIADKLFVSLSTVKTHSVNLYSKLDVKRRTQAVQKAKELKILP